MTLPPRDCPVEPLPLQDWAKAHSSGLRLIWREGYWDQIIFVRDRLHPVLVNKYEQRKASPVLVVGEHTSKSVRLPVYRIDSVDLGVTLWARYNFFDWKVSVRAVAAVPDVFFRLFARDDPNGYLHPVYFEGFHEDWIFPPYADNQEQFSCSLRDHYFLFTFGFLLGEALRPVEGRL